MSKINTIFTFTSGVPTSVVAIVDNKQYTADSSHVNWATILETIRKDDADGLMNAIDIKRSFENYVVGNVRVVGGEVFYDNTRLGGVVVDRIFDFMANKLPVEPIMLFINKLFQNPSSRAVNELYTFLEHKNMPITSEGNFRAYKGLRSDFYSITAGNLSLVQGKVQDGCIYNGVGETIECIRHQVDDNKDNTCSYGLHAGSLEYASGFAQGKMVIVEINPADVVSIPSDCDGQKLRTCKYKVVEEYVAPLDNTYVKTSSFNANPVPVKPSDDDVDDFIDKHYNCDYDDDYLPLEDKHGDDCCNDGCCHDDNDESPDESSSSNKNCS